MTRTVSRETCQMLGREIEAAIDPILERHGFKRGKTSRSYGEYFQIKVQATPVGADTPEEGDWKRYATLYGLPEDALGKEISLGGQTMKIVGLNTRARRMPVMLEAANGKSYKAPAESVSMALRFSAQ